MRTRMGTEVIGYRGEPDADGYLSCVLRFEDGSGTDEFRSIHIGDLRGECNDDQKLLEAFADQVALAREDGST